MAESKQNEFFINNTYNNPVPVEPMLYPSIDSIDKSVTNTASVISSDPYCREEITVLADEDNTANILIGGASNQLFPLVAGSQLTIKYTSLSLIYVKSVSGTQVLHVIFGGV